MNEAIWIYLGIGALIGAGMAILFVQENDEFPLSARLLVAAGVWILVTMIWPLTLAVLVLGRLRR